MISLAVQPSSPDLVSLLWFRPFSHSNSVSINCPCHCRNDPLPGFRLSSIFTYQYPCLRRCAVVSPFSLLPFVVLLIRESVGRSTCCCKGLYFLCLDHQMPPPGSISCVMCGWRLGSRLPLLQLVGRGDCSPATGLDFLCVVKCGLPGTCIQIVGTLFESVMIFVREFCSVVGVGRKNCPPVWVSRRWMPRKGANACTMRLMSALRSLLKILL
jgi:hypothetical protein